MILNQFNIGINVFNIADEILPKYYYLETIEDGNNEIGTFSVSLVNNDVNLKNKVSGTIEEIEEQLKYFVWEHIKDFETVRTPFKKIDLPTDALISESVNTFHRNMRFMYYELRGRASLIGLGFSNITNVMLHSDTKNYIYNDWGFNIKEKLDIGVTINDNLPRGRMIFSNVTKDTITHGNVCLVYKNIDNCDKTFTTFFDIISVIPDTIVSVDIPGRIFRQTKINELLK